MTFVITSLGRCGTLFLADALARSRTYVVRHEHHDDAEGWFKDPTAYDRAAHLEMTKLRFEGRTNYGEVNSCLRFIAHDLPVDDLGIIIRNPWEALLSSINKDPGRWRGLEKCSQMIAHTHRGLLAVDKLIRRGAVLVRFEQMITSHESIERVCRRFKITDVADEMIAIAIAKKLNVGDRNTIANLSELGPEAFKLLAMLQWFSDKYYKGAKP